MASSAVDFFLLESSLLALDGGGSQTFHQSFASLVELSLSLTNGGNLLIPVSLPCSTIEVGWRCTRGRPDRHPKLIYSSLPLRPWLDFPFSSGATWGGAE